MFRLARDFYWFHATGSFPRLVIFKPNPMKSWKKFPRVIFFLTLLMSLLAGLFAPVLGTKAVSAAQVGGLSILNSPSNVNPNVGSNVLFTIFVENTNAGNASTVNVLALLPTGLDYISDNSGGAYDHISGNWTIGVLNGGNSSTLIITAKVVISGSITFSATVTSVEFGPSSSSAVINGIPSTLADLKLTQVWQRANAAGRVDLKLTLTNETPGSTATNVQVKALLPLGLTYFSHTSNMEYISTTGIWSVATLQNGTPITLTISAKVAADGDGNSDPAIDGTIIFAEVWRSDQIDIDSIPGNGNAGEDDDTNYINASFPGSEVFVADLEITQTVDIAGVSNEIFTITVSNLGPDNASNVLVRNSILPTGYNYISHNATEGSYTPTSGEWVIPSLLDGATETLTVTTSHSGTTRLVNWAEVKGVYEVDPDSLPSNCSNSATSCIEDDDAGAPSADLSVTQSVNNRNPNIGDNVIFTITVSNAGPASITTSVQVKDTLPSGLTYASNDLGTAYVKNSGIWTIDTIANGESRTLNITAKLDANGIKTNMAEVWRSDEADPDSDPRDGSTTEDDDASATITTHRSIIINELAWGGTAASSEDEWIELYNPSSSPINITGWTLKSASGPLDITLAGTISAGGYFLLERGDNFTVSDVGADQIYAGGSSNILSDNGEVLTLRDGSTNFIDTANNENGGSWPRGSLSPNYGSMERIGTSTESDKTWATNIGNPKNGEDANDGPIYGTPRKVNSTGVAAPTAIPPTAVPPVGRPVINEFLARPGYDWNQDGKVDVFDEFIEVKNIGVVDISINGWKLDDEADEGSNPFTLPALTLKPGERAIFYGLQTNILLSDGGDTVRLLNPSNKVYDAYTYSIAKVEDQSVCRLPDGNGSWYEDCIPTPNLKNSREGSVPSMPGGEVFESPVCQLPDTLPVDFLFAECRGYGSDIWHSFYWDQFGWQGDQFVPENMSKWESFVE